VNRYAIKPGYQVRHRPRPYRDSLDDSRTYQLDVYRHAGQLARSDDVTTVLDVGCGLATKLMDFVAPHCDSITGIDCPAIIEQCRAMYADGHWIAADIEDAGFSVAGTYDLIICADVIEHLRDPDCMLRLLRDASHETTVVLLSTPERDLRRGAHDMGPPANPAHVREWNAAELAAYLRSRDFEVREAHVVELREGMRTCQMIVGRFGGGRR